MEPVATWLATADGAAQLLVITLGGLYTAFKIGGIVTAASKALAGFSAAAAGASGTGGAVGMAGRLRYALGSAGLLGALGGLGGASLAEAWEDDAVVDLLAGTDLLWHSSTEWQRLSH